MASLDLRPFHSQIAYGLGWQWDNGFHRPEDSKQDQATVAACFCKLLTTSSIWHDEEGDLQEQERLDSVD